MKFQTQLQLQWYEAKKISWLNSQIQNQIYQNLLTILKKLKIRGGFFLEIELVSKTKIQKLNQEYRNEDKITDVLSFPTLIRLQDAKFCQFLGTIYICTDKIIKQAKTFKQSPESELKFLVQHGFLHLLGFDHEQNPKIWQNLEKKFLFPRK